MAIVQQYREAKILPEVASKPELAHTRPVCRPRPGFNGPPRLGGGWIPLSAIRRICLASAATRA